mgnify:CR=1 FL=1|jgi:hypothetical protein
MSYPFGNPIQESIDVRLSKQYNIIFEMLEKQSPETCLRIIGSDDDLEEFHHILWCLPFYNSVYEISNKETMFNTHKIYCKIIDSDIHHRELFTICKLEVSKFLLHREWRIKKSIVNIRDDNEFTYLFSLILNSEPVILSELSPDFKLQIMSL